MGASRASQLHFPALTLLHLYYNLTVSPSPTSQPDPALPLKLIPALPLRKRDTSLPDVTTLISFQTPKLLLLFSYYPSAGQHSIELLLGLPYSPEQHRYSIECEIVRTPSRIRFLKMASWPGARRSSLSAVPFLGNHWAKNRSEIYLPRSSSDANFPSEWPELWRSSHQALSSTASGTLQPLSPRLSEASPPRTTSTAPIIGPHHTEDTGRSTTMGIKNCPKPLDQLEQFFHSPPASQQARSLPPVTAPARNHSAKLARLVDDVLHLQEEVSTQRFQARDLRQALRQKREEEDDLRLSLRNQLNLISLETAPAELISINTAIENLQVITASYQILEDDYHQIENELAHRESILDERIRKLTELLCKHATTTATTTTTTQQPNINGSGSDSLSIFSFPYNTNHISQAIAEYLSLVGEVRLMREQLSELKTQYLALLDQRDRSERIGITLDSEALVFLECYEEAKAKAKADLDVAIHRLQSHPEHKNHDESVSLNDDWKRVKEAFLPEQPDNANPPDPLRLTEFEDLSPFFEPVSATSLNKTAFINRWLLHQLRHSGFEIMRFKSSPAVMNLTDQGVDGNTISRIALNMWYHDDPRTVAPPRGNSAS
ncbi:hypothetical protein N7462_007512 [Penicillium macrosclerotiorum]|uniref:uncharacterized protein n=1 Tax=Penicillium macrosclerotiorum TaxID=303699 RepID=UPI0025498F8F|nr:uncharacterized protein N7462_007512 [Penicillium macrosclerotiorum]KAJ5679268.1 hypothetical protein N7462_007512 [Penicillium macrosclerotiorum]